MYCTSFLIGTGIGDCWWWYFV